MFLLDTLVLLELHKRERDPAVVAWLTAQRSDDLYLSVLSLGRLSAELGHPGADRMIAATALEHGLQVVTRNVRHFQPTSVAVLNPFSS